MRIPFIHRKEEDIRSIAARATRVGSAEMAWPKMRSTRTLQENREARERRRRRLNGDVPS